MGTDTDLTVSTSEQAASGMSLKEAIIAHNILAMQADIAAYRAARANGALSDSELNDAVAAVKHNYARHIRDALLSENDK